MNIHDFIRHIERIAPPGGQADWDNSGVQIAGLAEDITKVAITLDPQPEVIEAALEWGAQCILTHHPLNMQPRFLNKLDAHHHIISLVLGHQAWLYSAHTSLDVQPEGPVSWLPRELGLENLQVLDPTFKQTFLGARFHVGEAADAIAILEERIPQILHLEEATPGELLIVCANEDWQLVKERIDQELDITPAFGLLELALPGKTRGYGLVGDFPEPVSMGAFLDSLASMVDRSYFQISGPIPETINRVACCPGSGGSMIPLAAKAGADVFLTGDVKYHQALEAETCVIDMGHFILEEEMMRRLTQELTNTPPGEGMEFQFFTGREPFDLLLVESQDEEPA